MNVGQLIDQLQELDPSLLVVMSCDEEGNGFGEVREVQSDNRIFNDEDDGSVGYAALTPELEESGYTEDDIYEGAPCVVLWP